MSQTPTPTTPLATRPHDDQPLATVAGENPIAGMLAGILKTGMTSETAAVAEKLTDLYLKMEANSAKKQFTEAMTRLQHVLPNVVTNKIIPDKQDKVRSRFASYDHIWDTIRPHVHGHGFSVSFTTKYESTPVNRVTAFCTVSHVGGHSQMNECTARVGNGPPGSSDAQADAAARSLARRLALCDAFNINIEIDNDAKAMGGKISQAKADELRRRVEATKSNPARFLKIAQADAFENITVGSIPVLEEMLQQKEHAMQANPAGAGQQPDAPTTPTTTAQRKEWTTWLSDEFAEWQLAGQAADRFHNTVAEYVLSKAYKGKENQLTDNHRKELRALLASRAVTK